MAQQGAVFPFIYLPEVASGELLRQNPHWVFEEVSQYILANVIRAGTFQPSKSKKGRADSPLQSDYLVQVVRTQIYTSEVPSPALSPLHQEQLFQEMCS